MTNTKFRKRALLSSVAMLLVALVALGSATFAWFTSSSTSTANGINVKTVEASKLEISKSTHSWGTLVDYGVENKILLPASSANGAAWFSAEAAESTAFGANSTGFSSIDDTANYVFMEELNIRNTGEATVDVKIDITYPSGTTYARVAVVEYNGFALGSGTATGTFAQCVYDDAGTQYAAANAAGAVTGHTTNITPKTTRTITVGQMAKNAIKYYKIFVWFEGQDAQCYDTNAGQACPDVTFTVSGTNVSQIPTTGA